MYIRYLVAVFLNLNQNIIHISVHVHSVHVYYFMKTRDFRDQHQSYQIIAPVMSVNK